MRPAPSDSRLHSLALSLSFSALSRPVIIFFIFFFVGWGFFVFFFYNLIYRHFSPPVISGSHTLQHPSKRQQHEMMAHAHIQQNMRAMGTHTLGRLPSHNHSPTHMTGKWTWTSHPSTIILHDPRPSQALRKNSFYF